MAQQTQHEQRDTWSKVDILTKAFGVVFISGVIALYGIVSETKRAATQLQVAQKSSTSALYAEAMKNRQATEAVLKAGLMNDLLGRVFTRGKPEDRVLALELLAYNFHEQLDLKPLFHGLELVYPSNYFEVRDRIRVDQLLGTAAAE